MLVKNFETRQYLAKLQARKLIVSRTLCALALSCWKTKNSPDILRMAVVNCFTLTLTWLR